MKKKKKKQAAINYFSMASCTQGSNYTVLDRIPISLIEFRQYNIASSSSIVIFRNELEIVYCIP